MEWPDQGSGTSTDTYDMSGMGGEVFYLSEGEEEALEAEGTDRIDVLKLTGSDQVLDLSNLEGKLSSIEVIDLTGTGANTLKLTLGDVLEQGGKDLFVNDDKTQMMIKGAEGDVVELSDLLPEGGDVGDWAQQAGTVTVGGTTYSVFYHSGMNAELLVQQGVTELNIEYRKRVRLRSGNHWNHHGRHSNYQAYRARQRDGAGPRGIAGVRPAIPD